jgi:hypothetical protein
VLRVKLADLYQRAQDIYSPFEEGIEDAPVIVTISPSPNDRCEHAAANEPRHVSFNSVVDAFEEKAERDRLTAEYDRERAAVLSTAVGIARMELRRGHPAEALQVLDSAAARSTEMLREYLIASSAAQGRRA